MLFIADFHIHSRYSRATSRSLCPETLALAARLKGIAVVGSGDFTHRGWLEELREKLTEAEPGLYRLKPELQREVDPDLPEACSGATRFLLSGEISCIYKRDGRTRKIHHLILMPDFDAVRRLNARLERIGNLHSDGRPILGLDSRDLLEMVLEADERAFLIPAHIWTPWFSLFGSKSGFDALEECFGDLSRHIRALETGLSSDPPMNRRLSALDPYLLVSNSDAHSPDKLGREANLFDTPMDYPSMIRAMSGGQGFEGTIEFFPEEGKYHLDGHRKCGIRLEPRETRSHANLCPACGKPLTVGVLHRVDALADRDRPRLRRPFHSLIPLKEILAELLDCGPNTKKVAGLYEHLLAALGPELEILMDADAGRIEQAGGPLLAEAIGRMRRNRVIREGGYDGQFGTIRLFEPQEKAAFQGQGALFKPARPRPRSPKPAAPLVPAALRSPEHSKAKPAATADPVLDPLNPEQRQAVCYDRGHLLIVAGPGTGKTLTLTHRIAHLIRTRKASARRSVVLTFTRKAAREMAERLGRLLPREAAQGMFVGTFHAFCLDLLRQRGETLPPQGGFTLCSEYDREILAAQALARANIPRSRLRPLIRALPAIKIARALQSPLEELPSGVLEAFEAFEAHLREQGMLDLDDLEIEALRLLRGEGSASLAARLDWIFVDEYQDTSRVQVELLKALVRRHQTTVCAIGDPDQAIYGFRGADPDGFHRFAEDFSGAGFVELTRNYRSTSVILRAAAALMEKKAPLAAHRTPAVPIALGGCSTEAEEAEMIVEQVEKLIGGTTHFALDSGRVASHEGEGGMGFGDIAILFRLNAQGDALEAALSRAGLPVARSGERPLIQAPQAALVCRYLQTRLMPESRFFKEQYESLARELDLEPHPPEAGLSPAEAPAPLVARAVEAHFGRSADTLQPVKRLLRVAEEHSGGLAGFLDTLILERGIDHGHLPGDRIALMSLHAAKGLEWPVVFITGCEDGILPCTLFGNRDEAEERRLFYVGMTRARTWLFLTCAQVRTLGGRRLRQGPSPYLQRIPEEVQRPVDRGDWKPRPRGHRQLELF